MPWCEPCEQFFNPNTLTSEGSCPACGRLVGDAREDTKQATRVPWHFWLLCIATAGYLLWRFVQLGFRIF